MHQEYMQDLQITEQNIQQARSHIDHERAAIQKLRENGRDSQTAETLVRALELAVSVMEQHQRLIRAELALDRLVSGSGLSHSARSTVLPTLLANRRRAK
jgi:hypothetical protein